MGDVNVFVTFNSDLPQSRQRYWEFCNSAGKERVIDHFLVSENVLPCVQQNGYEVDNNPAAVRTRVSDGVSDQERTSSSSIAGPSEALPWQLQWSQCASHPLHEFSRATADVCQASGAAGQHWGIVEAGGLETLRSEKRGELYGESRDTHQWATATFGRAQPLPREIDDLELPFLTFVRLTWLDFAGTLAAAHGPQS